MPSRAPPAPLAPTAPPPRATIRDVAQQAGVSIASVSRFVNGRQRFSAPVEARIEAAIAAVGYRSDPTARAVATGRSGAVAVLAGGIEHSHTAALIKGVSRAAQRSGTDVLILDIAATVGTSGHAHHAVLEKALDLQVDGLLLAAEMPTAALERLAAQGRPFVDLLEVDLPDNAFEQAGRMIGHHLLLGRHRRVACLHGSSSSGSLAVLHGLRQAIGDAAHCEPVELAGTDVATGAAVAGPLLLREAALRPDAIVACCDELAMGLASEARLLGVQIPQDLSLVSVGNSVDAAYLMPALTTVELQLGLRGEWGLRRLLDGLANAPAGDPAMPLPPPRLVVRESTLARGLIRTAA